jgi:hypothetical protein
MGLPLPITPPTQLSDRPAEQLPTWGWLKDHRGGIVVEYPEVGNTAIDRYYMYGWAVHGHPILNAVNGPGDPAGEFTRTVIDPRASDVPALLAGAGIRYAVLNAWAYHALEIPRPRGLPAGFSLAARFPDGSEIWKVTARPSAGTAYFTEQGFDLPRIVGASCGRVTNWRWLIGRGVVRVDVAAAGRYIARFTAAPAAQPVRLSVTTEGLTHSVEVARSTRAAVQLLLPAGTSDVVVTAEPSSTGPSVQMTPWVLERAR